MRSILCLALVLSSLAACGPRQIVVPVRYLGHDPAVRSPAEVGTHKIAFSWQLDGVKDQIGENLQKSDPIPVIAARDEVAKFIQGSFEYEFKLFGFVLEADPAAATRRVDVSVTNFSVHEDNMFNADIAALLKVTDASGKVIAQKSYSGHGKRFGRSRNPREYNAALNNAVANLINGFMQDKEFIHALAAK
jgi:hypothetical protein